MTITEANAVNMILTYLLGKRRGYVLTGPSKEEIRAAAAHLAGRAYKTLSAGWTPEAATAAWDARLPRNRKSRV